MGENFVRYTGEVIDANEAQVFAWQARCKGKLENPVFVVFFEEVVNSGLYLEIFFREGRGQI